MKRVIFILLVGLNILFAQGRIIIPMPEPQPREIPVIPVELTKVNAQISISQDVAQVKLEQHFTNKSNRVLEGEYLYSLPGIAQIDDFYLYINGKKTKGEQTNYVCSPDVEDTEEELGLGTKSVSPESMRKSTVIIL